MLSVTPAVSAVSNWFMSPNQTLLVDVSLLSAAAPQPGQTVTDSPFSLWSNGRESGATFTIK